MSDQVEERRAKLAALRDAGIEPFPHRYPGRVSIAKVRAPLEAADEAEAASEAAALPAEGEESSEDAEPPEEVRVAGRVLGRRNFGKMVFLDVGDESGRVQILVRKGDVPDEFHHFARKTLDAGDFLGVRGTMGRTKTGEITVFAVDGELLSKSLRPLPEKWHGLTDPDLRVRFRYVDLLASPEVRAQFRLRSQVVHGLRSRLAEKEFLEVETPILHPIAGGATARPFVTHHNALDLELYLRIAPELYLKRLLVGGFERVFEIGRVFRNEGISTRHNPEFTMLELYWAYVDDTAIMDLTEELIVSLAKELTDDGTVTIGESKVDLNGPFRRAPFKELLREHAGVDPDDLDAIRAKLKELRVADVDAMEPAKLYDELFDVAVNPLLEQPTFVTQYPTELSPLAKQNADDPSICDRFELFIHGWEVANAFAELNDPLEQRRRFEEQVASKDPETPGEVDEDYLRALEHGMPPAGGLGIGIDRLVMVLGGFESIRETILFPLRRPTADERGDDPLSEQAEGAAEA